MGAMQCVLYPLLMICTAEDFSHNTAEKCWSTYTCEILVVVACKLTWQNMWAHQTITNNICQNINAELLLVSRVEHTIRIVLCPLVVVVNVYDAISANTCII
jgi:hypothetical protein